jgi:hypothetical protein
MTFMHTDALRGHADEARQLITWVSTTFGIHDGDPIEWASQRHELKQHIDDVVNALIDAAIDAVLMVAAGGLPGLVKAIIDAIATLITALTSEITISGDVWPRERRPLDLRKLDEIHQLVLRAAAKSGNPVLAEPRSGRSTAYRELLAEGASRLKRSAVHLRPVDIRTDVDDRVLRRTVSELAIWVEQFEADWTQPPPNHSR